MELMKTIKTQYIKDVNNLLRCKVEFTEKEKHIFMIDKDLEKKLKQLKEIKGLI